MKRRIISLMLIVLILLNSLTYTYAKTIDSDETIANYRYSITARLTELESFLADETTGQYGLLYELRIIEEYSMYVKAMVETDELGYATKEIKYYKNQLHSMVKKFNSQYNVESKEFSKIGLKNPNKNTEDKEFCEKITTNLDSKIPPYLISLLDKVQKSYDTAETDSKKNGVLRKNATLLSNIYQCVAVYQDVPNTITNVTPTDKNGAHVSFTVSKDTVSIITKLASSYTTLLIYGKKVDAQESDEQSLEIDLEEEYVEMFSDAVVGDSGIEIPDEPTLSLPYLAMVACSSVYTPLESYVGSEEFTSSLKALAVDEENAANLAEVYNRVKDIRKPLYKRALSSEGSATGVATICTIEEFFEDIENGSVGSLCTIDGDFHYNSEAQSWIYNFINNATKPVDSSAALVSTEEDSEDEEGTVDSIVQEDENLDEQEETTDPTVPTTTINSIQGLAEDSNVQQVVKDTFTGSKISATAASVKKMIVTSTIWKATVGTSIKIGKAVLSSIAKLITANEPTVVHADTLADYKDMITGLKNTIFIGDSRTVGLRSAMITAGDLSESDLKENGVHFIAQIGKGYDYFSGDVVTEVEKILKSGTASSYTIVFNFGVNDLGNCEKYYTKINELVGTDGSFEGVKFVVQSVGAVDESKDAAKNVSNNSILSFNDKMKNNLADGVDFVDVTTAMLNEAQNGLADGYSTSDGLHYEQTTYLKLIQQVLNNTQDVDTSTSTGESTDSVVADVEETTESGLEGEEDLSKATYAYNEITDESKMSESILVYGTKYARNYDNMTTAIMKNILSDTVNVSAIENKNTRYLYMNAFGDIVTDDNLVILPGIANPLLYSEESYYNPYTAAFMNAYPSVLGENAFFKITSKADIGKYVIMVDSLTEDTSNAAFEAFQICENNNVRSTTYLNSLRLNTTFYVNTSDSYTILGPQHLILGNINTWEDSPMYDYSTICTRLNATVNGKTLFPYVVSEDTDFKVARAIACNAYQQLTLDTSTNKVTNLKQLNDNYILHNMLISCLGGTNNPQGYAKNELLEYDNFTNSSSNRISKTVKELSDSILDKTSNVDSVIGLKSAYEDPILGTIFTQIRENWIIFFFVIALILLIAFMKLHRDLLQTIILMIASCGFMYLFVYVVPVYLPMLYNVVINNTCENLTYEILAAKTEQNDAEETNLKLADSNGNFKLNTSSLTLYRVGSNELTDFYKSLGVSAEEVTAGNTVIIDQDSGEFVEGDSIKVNTDLLFQNLDINGVYDDSDGTSTYILEANKTVSDNLDYYVPYYQFVDGFIGKLNTLAEVYNIPRSTTVYTDGKNKDNYLVYSYTNSLPFLTPGKYTSSTKNGSSIDITANGDLYTADDLAMAEKLEAAFGTNADWLGIADVLWELDDTSKKTLWAQTLRANGYYDENWEAVPSKMNKLITYVNKITKNFVFDMEDQIGQLSDSTMIKVISLRALVAFTQESSQYGSWLYPFSLNYAELSLDDVLVSVFTDDYTQYISMGSDINAYLLEEHGWFNLVIFDLLVILMFVVTNVIKILVPVMYILLGVMLLVKIVMRGDLKTTFSGYIKCSLLIFACFTFFDISICVIKGITGSAIAIYALVLCNLIIVYALFLILSSILFNITDLGNEQIGVKLKGVTDKGLIKNLFNSITVQTTKLKNEHYNRNRSNVNQDVGYSRLDDYATEVSVESFYNTGRQRHQNRR